MLEMYTNANLCDSAVGMSSLFYKMNKKFLSWKEHWKSKTFFRGLSSCCGSLSLRVFQKQRKKCLALEPSDQNCLLSKSMMVYKGSIAHSFTSSLYFKLQAMKCQ